MWNEKSLRLRVLRDKLHLTGKYAPTVHQAIDLLVEILGWIHSPRNLVYCRREFAKVRARVQEPSMEDIKLFSFYEDKLAKKAELIAERKKRRLEKKPKKTAKSPAVPTPAPGEEKSWLDQIKIT